MEVELIITGNTPANMTSKHFIDQLTGISTFNSNDIRKLLNNIQC